MLIIRLYTFLLLVSLLLAPAVQASVSGEAEFNYVDYSTSGGDRVDVDASHFTQRYSLLYEQQGLIASGRAGYFDVGLGFQWAQLNNDIDGNERDKDAYKVLYHGVVDIAPGGLPFRLNAFSQDLSDIRFIDGKNSVLRSGLFNPGIITDLANGQTTVSGITLMAGIRNGTYLGKFRDVMSKLPRFLMDYRDVYHRDLKSDVPTKYRDRNLAFVSLNKKDNWFHYRIHDYQDYMNHKNDSKQTQFILGTIDHTMRRQWIHLTNWIRMSADGSFSTVDDVSDRRINETYNLNLFTLMNTRNTSLSNFTSLQRERLGGRVESQLDIPFYTKTVLSLDTTLRGQLLVWRELEEVVGLNSVENDSYYGKIKAETLKRRRVQIDPTLEMELHTGNDGEGHAVRALLESYSNYRYNQIRQWSAQASLAYFSGDGNKSFNGSYLSSNYLEAEVGGEVSFRLQPQLKMTLSQNLIVGDGTYGYATTRVMSPALSTGPASLDGAAGLLDSQVWRSYSLIGIEHVARNAMRNTLQISHRYQNDVKNRSGNSSFSSTKIKHLLRYAKRAFKLDADSTYVYGDDDYDSNLSSKDSYSVGGAEYQFFHKTRLKYSPSSKWETSLDAFLEYQAYERGGDRTYYRLDQRAQRSFYKANGVVRRLLNIRQSMQYAHSSGAVSNQEKLRFSLYAEYLPNSFLTVGSGLYYQYYNYRDAEIGWRLDTTLDFPKLQVAFNYKYATDEETSVQAHRYEVNIKKLF